MNESSTNAPCVVRFRITEQIRNERATDSKNFTHEGHNFAGAERLCWDCVFVSGYVPPPKVLPAFPEAKRAQPKTWVSGGGGMRIRWKDRDYIYEWDYQHGHVERYDLRGKPLGAFDHITGSKLKEAAPGRRNIEP